MNKLKYSPEGWRLVKMPEYPCMECSTMDCNGAKCEEQAISEAILIAPQDQEKVAYSIWKAIVKNNPTRGFNNWKPDHSKLYDCVELEFELRPFCKSCTSLGNGIRHCAHPEECGAWTEVWVLKSVEEKVKEELPKGFVDWNKYSLDELVTYLENKWLMHSSGEALAIGKLCKFYRDHSKK